MKREKVRTDGKSERGPLLLLLSILVVLLIAILTGAYFMQIMDEPEASSEPEVVVGEDLPMLDDFDPYTLVMDDVPYPGLEENPPEEDSHEEILQEMLDEDEGVPEELFIEKESSIPRVTIVNADRVSDPPASQGPVKMSHRQPSSPLRDSIRENAWWIQVFSSLHPTKAEEVRKSLYDKGLPPSILVQSVSGQIWYRVRIGAFGTEAEAKRYAALLDQVHELSSNFVLQAPVTRGLAR